MVKEKQIVHKDGFVETPNARVESQTFGGIGLFEAINGEVVLRGRKGHRDMIFPLHRAVDKYNWAIDMAQQMVRTGMKGWDTMLDFCDDFAAKICEAVDQRRSLNIESAPKVLEFYEKHYKQK